MNGEGFLGARRIGSGRRNTFAWSDGTTLRYTNWKRGEPNNWDENEDCIHLYADGKWNDIPCSTPSSFVCKSHSNVVK